MFDIFALLLLGHLFGDWVFQPKWMAVNKSASHMKCFLHCLFYTSLIALFALTLNIVFLVIVFVTHFLIDRFSFADKWLDFIKGRSLIDFLKCGQENIPMEDDTEWNNYYILRGGFTCMVYAVVDNTFHITINYFAYVIVMNFHSLWTDFLLYNWNWIGRNF